MDCFFDALSLFATGFPCYTAYIGTHIDPKGVTHMPMLGAILTPPPARTVARSRPWTGAGHCRYRPRYGESRKNRSPSGIPMFSSSRRLTPFCMVIIFISPPAKAPKAPWPPFRAPQVQFTATYDAPLRDEIIRRAESAGLTAGTLGQRDPSLDHGVLIPLYYLRRAGVHCPICAHGPIRLFVPCPLPVGPGAWPKR